MAVKTTATAPQETLPTEPDKTAETEVKQDATVTAEPSTNGQPKNTFTYTPVAGGEPIELPLDFDLPGLATPEDRIWLFDYNDLPLHEQTWIWLRRAKVLRSTAHRVVSLPFDEQLTMVGAWLKAARGIDLGE